MIAWRRLLAALGPHREKLQLRPAASEENLHAAEATLGWRLPDDYRAWLALANGQDDGGMWILPCAGRLLSIEEAIARRRVDEFLTPEEYEVLADTVDSGRVRRVGLHPQRLVVAHASDTSQDLTWVDMVPGPNGVAGQILVNRDVDFETVGSSLGDLFDRIAALVERGNLVATAFADYERTQWQLAKPAPSGRKSGRRGSR